MDVYLLWRNLDSLLDSNMEIKTEQNYNVSNNSIETLRGAKKDTPQGDELDLPVTLVESYEIKHFPIGSPDPVDAIKFRMEQSGLTPKDLIPMIGQLNRVYEVLNRKRSLTLAMIRKLHNGLGISAESLIRPPQWLC